MLEVPLSGNVLEVEELPIRFTHDHHAVEGSRLCVVLNALRELMYPPDGAGAGARRPDMDALSHLKITRDSVLLHLQVRNPSSP